MRPGTPTSGPSAVLGHAARRFTCPDPAQAASPLEREAWLTVWSEQEVLTVEEIACRLDIGVPEAAASRRAVVARQRAVEQVREHLDVPTPALMRLAWLLDPQETLPREDQRR
jgi:hypothetical protein